ncbi:MAG: ComEC/Rec2 family competence protein [Acidobacteria bacterium]|nr:ComEC/Rec2 family competence protein [Acidobacteriota bacterium]
MKRSEKVFDSQAVAFILVALMPLGILWGMASDCPNILLSPWLGSLLWSLASGLVWWRKPVSAACLTGVFTLWVALSIGNGCAAALVSQWDDSWFAFPVELDGEVVTQQPTKFGTRITLRDVKPTNPASDGFPSHELVVYFPPADGVLQRGERIRGWVRLHRQHSVRTLRLPFHELNDRLKPRVYGSVKDWRLMSHGDLTARDNQRLSPLANELYELFFKGQPARNWRDLLQPLGVGHLLAISGMHCLFVYLMVRVCLFWVRQPYLRTVAVVTVLISFAGWMGWSASVVRATIMLIIWQIMPITNRPRSWLRGWSALMIALLVLNPTVTLQRGFWYTFAASLGIVLGLRRTPKSAFDHPLDGTLRWFLPVLAAQVFVMPIGLMFTGHVNLISAIWNLAGMVLLIALVGLAVLAAIAHVVPAMAGGVNTLVDAVGSTCEWLSSMDLAFGLVRRPQVPCLVVVCLLVFSVCLFLGKREVRWYLLLAMATVWLFLGRPQLKPGLLMLDVGQGQACALVSETGDTLLIDGGGKLPWGITLDTALKLSGSGRLVAAAISHHNADHYNLLDGVAADVPLLVPQTQAYLFATNPWFGSHLLYPLRTGDMLPIGSWEVTVAWPDAGEDGPNSNETGLVLCAQDTKITVWIMGDAGHYVEQRLEGTCADVLVVGHHGSRSASSDDWIRRLNPELSLISCGRENRFGHPHLEVLTSLESTGSQVLNSAVLGSIHVDSNLIVTPVWHP